MSQPITCPYCGYTTSTSKEIKGHARARCPKCKEVFDIKTEFNGVELAEPLESHKPASFAQYEVGDVYGSVKVEPEDSPSAEDASDVASYDSHERVLPRLPEFPAEPWFYGHLWKHGKSLQMLSNVVLIALLLMEGLVVVAGLRYLGTLEVGPLILVGLLGIAFSFAIWFWIRILAASVLLRVDEARNIRTTWFAIRHANYL